MTAPVVVHLMRHGAPVLTGRLLGRTDCAVTAEGIDACRHAAATLDVRHIVSSDLIRAVECATAIAGRHCERSEAMTTQSPHHIDPRWRELDFGAWDGCAPASLDPAALADFWRDPDAHPPPDGERWSTLVARVGAALGELDTGTLVVTHGGAIRATLASACGFDAQQVWAFDLPYAAVVTLHLWAGAAQIVRLVA